MDSLSSSYMGQSTAAYMPTQVYFRSDTCSESGLLREVVRGSSSNINININPSSSNQSTVEPKEYSNGFGILQFSAFRCNQLPPCTVTCDGPDEALIRSDWYNVCRVADPLTVLDQISYSVSVSLSMHSHDHITLFTATSRSTAPVWSNGTSTDIWSR